MGASTPLTRRTDPHEEGLWNLDEEWNTDRANSEKPVQEKAAPAPEVATPAPQVIEPTPAFIEPSTEPSDDHAEPVTRIEPTYSRRRLARNQRRNEEIEELPETAAETQQIEEAPSQAETQDHAEPNSLPSASRGVPVGFGLTEDEVWSDFLSDDEPDHAEMPEAMPFAEQVEMTTATEPAASEPAAHEISAVEHEEARFVPIENETPAPEAEIPGITTQKPAEADTANDNPVGPPQPSITKENPQSNAANQTSLRSFLKLSRLEWLACLLFFSFLTYGVLWSVQAFRSEVQAQPNPYQQPDLPSNGTWATVRAVNTFWRKPILEGANADTVRQDVTMIPVARISLGSCASSHGSIRVIFYNDKGSIAGDTVTHRFENHCFSKSGALEQTFSATTGFTSFGDQEAYRARLVKPWTIRVYEGPDENAPSSAYRLLFSAPISTIVE
ncbi:MAG: hypothetical protein RI957_1260 [Verrucomicrobiota bacterium]